MLIHEIIVKKKTIFTMKVKIIMTNNRFIFIDKKTNNVLDYIVLLTFLYY